MFSSLFVCLFVNNFAQKNVGTDLHEIFKEGWQWASEQMMKFWWRSVSGIRIWIWIRIAALVRRALTEVCTVPVLLVCFFFNSFHKSTQCWMKSLKLPADHMLVVFFCMTHE